MPKIAQTTAYALLNLSLQYNQNMERWIQKLMVSRKKRKRVTLCPREEASRRTENL